MRIRTNQLNVVFFKDAVLIEIKRTIQSCLTAHRGQYSVGALFFDDFFDDLPGDGLDVGYIGGFWVGHDSGRIAVDQHCAIALCFEGFAGLCA